eukprot:NODE_5_length_72347_cov_1.339331.p14 type:complete len:519 gc:universal NODE_5_length_72347_cov_1.339331:17275-15719(-)
MMNNLSSHLNNQFNGLNENTDGPGFLKEIRQKNNDQASFLIQLEDGWYDKQTYELPTPIRAINCSFPCINANNFVGMLKKFCQRRKLRLPSQIDSLHVSWVDVKTKVDQFHGAKMVSSKRQWYYVSQCCGINNQEKLKQYYFQYLRKFEEYIELIGLDDLDYEGGGFLTFKGNTADYETSKEYFDASRDCNLQAQELYDEYIAKNNLGDLSSSKLEFFWNEVIGGKSENYFIVPKIESKDLEISLFPDIYGEECGSNHPLNFNKLRKAQESLLKYGFWKGDSFEESSLQIGSLFSYSLWETNQQFMYSLYCIHEGAPRVWYTISSKHISKLYNLINSKYPEILKNDGIPRNIPIPIEPKELKEAAIPFSTTTQNVGQILAIFPGSYYFSVDLGSNIVERLNLVTPEWIPHGFKYKKFCESMSLAPSLCMEELLFKQVKYQGGDKSAKWIKEHWKRVATDEIQLRCQMMYYFDALKFEQLPIDTVSVRVCTRTSWPCFFTFLEDQEGQIYHPKALVQVF